MIFFMINCVSECLNSFFVSEEQYFYLSRLLFLGSAFPITEIIVTWIIYCVNLMLVYANLLPIIASCILLLNLSIKCFFICIIKTSIIITMGLFIKASAININDHHYCCYCYCYRRYCWDFGDDCYWIIFYWNCIYFMMMATINYTEMIIFTYFCIVDNFYFDFYCHFYQYFMIMLVMMMKMDWMMGFWIVGIVNTFIIV